MPDIPKALTVQHVLFIWHTRGLCRFSHYLLVKLGASWPDAGLLETHRSVDDNKFRQFIAHFKTSSMTAEDFQDIGKVKPFRDWWNLENNGGGLSAHPEKSPHFGMLLTVKADCMISRRVLASTLPLSRKDFTAAALGLTHCNTLASRICKTVESVQQRTARNELASVGLLWTCVLLKLDKTQ